MSTLHATKRPTRKKAWAIIGHADSETFYFFGTGFSARPNLVLTFADQLKGHERMKKIVDKLPSEIEAISLEQLK